MEAERTCLDCREVRSWWVFSKDLRLLQKNASKPSTVLLLANDGTPLSSDTDKLKRRAEHFSNVVNGPTEISVDSLSNLPSVALQLLHSLYLSLIPNMYERQVPRNPISWM